MTEFLIIVGLLALVALLAGAGFATALARRSKKQADADADLALGTALSTDPPREWVGAHTPEAKLHRRLVAAARSLSKQPPGGPDAIEQRVDVEQKIVELDRRLIAAATAPASLRNETVEALEPEVSAAESEVAALAAQSGES